MLKNNKWANVVGPTLGLNWNMAIGDSAGADDDHCMTH